MDGDHTQPRQVRRTALSTISYLLRWQNRPTPHGLFAGVTTAGIGPAHAQWGDKHRLLVRADAEWVTDVVLRLQDD